MKPLSGSESIRGEPSQEVESRLEALILRYGPFIRDVVARLCPHHLGLDRGEIEQNALIRLWRVLESEREIRDFESYMYRIVASVTLDAVREVHSRREEQVVPWEVESLTASPVMPGSNSELPEAVLSSRRLIEQIRGLIEKLPLNRRRAVKLYLMGFTSIEAGSFLGWSEPKARNLTYRGLEDLRRLLRQAGLHDAE